MDPLTILAGLTVVLFLGGGFALNRYVVRGSDPAWRNLARARGGSFSTGMAGPKVVLEVEEVEITLYVMQDQNGQLGTRVAAHRTGSSWWVGPTFSRRSVAGLATLPHVAFRDARVAKAVGVLAFAQISASDGNVSLSWRGAEESRHVLEAAIELATLLANAAEYGALHELPQRRRVGDRRDAVELEVDGTKVLLEGTSWGGTTGVVMTVHCERDLPRFAIQIDEDGTLTGDSAPGLLRGGDLRPPSRMGEALLKFDGDDLRLYIRPIFVVADLERAVRCVATLSEDRGSAGAFR